jgi:hypothetical protein
MELKLSDKNKYEALHRAWNHLLLAWQEVYQISADENIGELSNLRNDINNLEIKCINIRNTFKGE